MFWVEHHSGTIVPEIWYSTSMGKLGRERFVSRLARAPITYVVLVLLCFLFAWSAVGAYHKSRVAKKKMQASAIELAKLEDQREKLSTELGNATTPFGQEKALREKFNVVREGEEVIMIVEPESSAPIPEEEGGFSRFWKRLFGR